MAELADLERRLVAEVNAVRQEIRSIQTAARVREVKAAEIERTLVDVVIVTGVAPELIVVDGRALAHLRWAWWWLAHHVGGASTYEIGKTTGWHHTTVLVGIRRALERAESRAIIEAVLSGEAAALAAELGVNGPAQARAVAA